MVTSTKSTVSCIYRGKKGIGIKIRLVKEERAGFNQPAETLCMEEMLLAWLACKLLIVIPQ